MNKIRGIIIGDFSCWIGEREQEMGYSSEVSRIEVCSKNNNSDIEIYKVVNDFYNGYEIELVKDNKKKEWLAEEIVTSETVRIIYDDSQLLSEMFENYERNETNDGNK